MNRTAARIHGPQKVSSQLVVAMPSRSYSLMSGTAKQCYHCQGLGHVQADCPTLRLSGAQSGGRCYTCGQPGHLAVCIRYFFPVWNLAKFT